MADTQVLEACAERCEGSSPSVRTKYLNVVEWHTRWSKKPVPRGLRVQVPPLRPSKFYGVVRELVNPVGCDPIIGEIETRTTPQDGPII